MCVSGGVLEKRIRLALAAGAAQGAGGVQAGHRGEGERLIAPLAIVLPILEARGLLRTLRFLCESCALTSIMCHISVAFLVALA
jgi:hypothetical protein